MDNKWYRAIMVSKHILSGYEKGLQVYFKMDSVVNRELVTKAIGEEAVKEIQSRVIVYDGLSDKSFTIQAERAKDYIKACRDENNKLIPASDQGIIQYSYVVNCK